MKIVALVLTGLLLTPIVASLDAAPRPHVLLLLVDDLKPNIGAFGDPVARTPQLDRLCARGVRFERAYCNQAVCAPSRNNLLTGVRSTTSGLYSLGVNFRYALPHAVTLPQWFMRHGYVTAGAGKVFHIGHGNTDDPASWSEPFQPDKVIDYVMTASTGGALTREQAFFSNAAGPNKRLPRGAAWECEDVLDTAYADGRIAEFGIRRLRQAAREPNQPLFLALGFCKPHLPFCAPKRYWDHYRRERMPLAPFRQAPQGAPAYAHKALGELSQYRPIPERKRGLLEDDLQRTLVHGYYACVSYVDAQIGKVLDALDRLGLADNTLIVLWGDHGWHLGDHGSWTKHDNYEEANRIPVVFAGPGIPRGAATQALLETVDIYPTLCALAGLPAPQGRVPQPCDGLSQLPVLRDPTQSVRDYVYHAFPRGSWQGQPRIGRAIRTARYRLVEWRAPDAPADSADWELYDYQDDPLETVNLAAERPELVARLRLHLAAQPEAKPQAPRR